MVKKVRVATEISAKYKDMAFVAPASRSELFVRIILTFVFFIIYMVYAFVYSIIILVFSFVASILQAIQWLIILITAKRWNPAFEWSARALYEREVHYSIKLFNYQLRFLPYLNWMTDVRPPFGMEEKNESYFRKVK